jgi:general secretion pathway protein N
MRKGYVLAAVGAAAFLLILVATLPVSLFTRYLPPALTASGLSGSVWHGHAAAVAFRNQPLGGLSWSVKPLRLFVLQVAYDVELERPDGHARAIVSVKPGGVLVLTAIDARLPVEAFAGTLSPRGWTGEIEAAIKEARISAGWVDGAEGVIRALNLKAPRDSGAGIGSFELTLGAGAVGTDALTGRLRDLGGPLNVRGTLAVRRDRSYVLEGEVAPGPGATPGVFRSLAFLGEPDAQGRRPFAVEGTF